MGTFYWATLTVLAFAILTGVFATGVQFGKSL